MFNIYPEHVLLQLMEGILIKIKRKLNLIIKDAKTIIFQNIIYSKIIKGNKGNNNFYHINLRRKGFCVWNP